MLTRKRRQTSFEWRHAIGQFCSSDPSSQSATLLHLIYLKLRLGSIVWRFAWVIYLSYTFVLRFALKLIFVAFFASVRFVTTIFAILVAIAIFKLINATFQWSYNPVPSIYLIELATVPSKDRTKSHLLLEPGSWSICAHKLVWSTLISALIIF